jgi:hypothetical protein
MNLINQWHIRCPCGLSMDWCRPWLASLPLETQALFPQYRQSLEGSFLKVYLICGFEILVYSSPHCKLFRKLSLDPRRFSMSKWHLIEHKEVCCLMFPRAIGLKIHCILYKIFFNESFNEYLNYIKSFVNNYCVPYSNLVWSRGTILNEDESTA